MSFIEGTRVGLAASVDHSFTKSVRAFYLAIVGGGPVNLVLLDTLFSVKRFCRRA
jgi:hypothetical protein